MCKRLCFAVILLGLPLATFAGEDQGFVLKPMTSPKSGTLIINGKKVEDPTLWPATFSFGQGKEDFCTATAIGSRVILTAAHCLPDRASLDPIHVTLSGSPVVITCTPHPDYTPCPKTDAEWDDLG